jgi:hypothetical protein
MPSNHLLSKIRECFEDLMHDLIEFDICECGGLEWGWGVDCSKCSIRLLDDLEYWFTRLGKAMLEKTPTDGSS